MSVNYNPATPTDGLLLCIDPSNPRCYLGSGATVFDLSGNGNNGTLTNGASVVNTTTGRVLNFDGVNDVVIVKSLAPAYGFSYSCWFKAVNASKARQSLFCNATDESNPDIYLHIEATSGTINAMNFYDGQGYLGLSTTFIQDTNWHHYAWTTNASGVVKYFRDGVFLGSPASNWTTVRNDNDPSASIGGIGALFGLGFTAEGQMDDCRRYSRTLTDNEIRQLFESKRGKYL